MILFFLNALSIAKTTSLFIPSGETLIPTPSGVQDGRLKIGVIVPTWHPKSAKTLEIVKAKSDGSPPPLVVKLSEHARFLILSLMGFCSDPNRSERDLVPQLVVAVLPFPFMLLLHAPCETLPWLELFPVLCPPPFDAVSCVGFSPDRYTLNPQRRTPNTTIRIAE